VFPHKGEEGDAPVGRRLTAFPAEALQHLGLLIALVLLIAAKDFAGERPGLAAGLVFAFSLPYLMAAVATQRAHFLYATMLLGAVAYFLTCYALGAPALSFPVLSVPLVVALWLVGRHLRRRLSPDLASFPATVFRAMNITVATFAAWALVQAPRLAGQPGFGRYVAGIALLGYAALYLAHAVAGAPACYAYVSSGFLVLGSMLGSAAVWSASFCWLAGAASTLVLLFVATSLHRSRTLRWSRHFFLCAVGTILLSLVSTALEWRFLLLDLTLTSLTLWLAYGWLAEAVGDVRRATQAERALAKWLFLGSIAFTLPVIPATLALPVNAYAAAAALACGLTLGWVALRRREASPARNVHVLPAAWLLAAGALGLSAHAPAGVATALLVMVPAALVLGLALLHARLGEKGAIATRLALAEAAVFPAFLAWYVALVVTGPLMALVAVGVALGACVAMVSGRRDPRFLYAAGPACAGAAVSAALLSGHLPLAWMACAAAASAAGVAFAAASADGRHQVVRGAANLAWLVLSAAAVVLAAASGAAQALYAATTVGGLAILVAGWRGRRGRRDLFDTLVTGVGTLAAMAAVVLGPLSGLRPAGAGACVLALSAACLASWAMCQGVRLARAAGALFALGTLLVIFGRLPLLEARLAAGAGVVAALFVAAALAKGRFPSESRGWTFSAHVAGIALACAALIQGWPGVDARVAGAAGLFALLYALMPRLRDSNGSRVGTVCWLTLAVLFSLAAAAATPYRAQAPLLGALALAWLALGFGVQRGRVRAWSPPLYVCAALLAAFCGLVSLFTPAAQGTWAVFLVNGIVFAALFLILRKDIFAFLLTLALALMAYDWVKASTSRFTQDVLFYLVIGTGVLGTFYLLPYLKRLVDRLGTLPMFSIFTWRGAAITAVPVVFGGFVVLSAYSIKITEHPKFCISCHYMGEYYESWQHSSHRDVACVECHYEPGVEAELEGKMAGLVQLVKYMSHAYDSKPHALISNKSCMRSGCHAGMDHNKETVLFHGKVKFSHEKHLSGHPRGKELNCVSCHGQMVEGQHISVAQTTCLTCHFYGRGSRPVAAGECQTCHTLPEKTVTFEGQAFNHAKFLKGKSDVRCEHCHSQITQGVGAVSPTRCQSCHLRRTPEVKDQEQFHLTHVSKGHFDCLQCHDEIRHGEGMKPHQMMASSQCGTCHGDERHSIQARMYAGQAVADVPAEPDVMYKAGVACDGCHIEDKTVAVGDASYVTRAAGPRPCAACHGDKDYGDMLADWQKETRNRLAALTPRVAALEKACETSQPGNGNRDQARQLVATAKGRLSCIERDGSYGAHNYAYTSTLLDRAAADLKKAAALLNVQAKATETAP